MQTQGAPSLENLLAGRRRTPRRSMRLAVRLKGARGEYPGSVRDLSAGGALVHVPVEALQGGASAPPGPGMQFALLERHFRESFDVVFAEAGFAAEAQVVRLLVAGGDAGELALGCRFLHALARPQQEALGLVEPVALPDWEEAVAMHALVHPARPGSPIFALVGDDTFETRGPLCVGPVLAAGQRVVAVALEGVLPAEAIGRLYDEQVAVRLVAGRRVLVDLPGALYAVRYVDLPRPGSEVLLLLGAALPRSVRRRLRRRPAA